LDAQDPGDIDALRLLVLYLLSRESQPKIALQRIAELTAVPAL
jgi:hypothetical protein